MRLTVKERILLHLLESGNGAESLEVPRTVTQERIAEASWIRRRHLSQYIRPLVEEDLVAEGRAHVEGIRQKRKVYQLTALGKLKAVTLQEKVMGATLRVRDEGGTRDLSVAQALSEADGSATLLKIVRLAKQGEPVHLDELEAPEASQFVVVLRDAPQVNNFIGRTMELEAITGESAEGRLFVVRGVAGIGKSSLAAEACERLRGKRNLFWHRVRPWDSRDSILSRLGAFLATLGKPGLQAVIKRGDVDRAPDVFREDLSGTQSLLVFDDAHEADPEILPFLRLLVEALADAPDARALLLTRRALSFYSRRDVVLRNLVQEFELQGLESHEVAAYLSDHEMPEASFEVAQRLHGHPLFLDLLRAHNPFSSALVDVRHYLEEEVYTVLPDAERGMMKIASIYRVPVPRTALFANPEWHHEVLLALTNRSLLRSVGENRFEAHDTIRDFFEGILTASEETTLGEFAVRQLRELASKAWEDGKFPDTVSYISNALRLTQSAPDRTELWESLGDANGLMGDLSALSIAYREAVRRSSDRETQARLHRKLASALQERGEFRAATEEVEAGFQALGNQDSPERGWLELVRARTLFDREWREAQEHCEAALDAFEASGDLRGRAEALMELGSIALSLGATSKEGLPLSGLHLRAALEVAERLADPDLIAEIRIELIGLGVFQKGDTEEAEAHLEALMASSRAMQNPLTRQRVVLLRAWFNQVIRNDLEVGKADIDEGMRLAAQNRDASGVIVAKGYLAHAQLQQGDIGAARRTYEENAEESMALDFGVPYHLFKLGECCLMEGDREGFRQVLQAFNERKPPKVGGGGWLEWGSLLRGFEELLEGNHEQSIASFEEALIFTNRLPPQSYLFGLVAPIAYFTYGMALRAMGKGREASKRIRRSLQLYRSRNMPGSVALMAVKERLLADGLRALT